MEKVADYRSIGVRECWLVSPEAETVEILRLTPERAETISTLSVNDTLRSDVLPDFEAAVARLFEI
jgi:Uma2 family endonuclease